MEIRKIYRLSETIYMEARRPLEDRPRIAVAAAVLRNPWVDGPYIEDMSTAAWDVAFGLGELLTRELAQMNPGVIEAYGKAAIVGTGGEIEHGSALIHTLRFGDHLRKMVNGSTLLPAVEKRAATGTTFDIPLKHIQDATIRSHHQTVEVTIADSPHPDEIVVAIAAATTGRPLARLATLSTSETR